MSQARRRNYEPQDATDLDQNIPLEPIGSANPGFDESHRSELDTAGAVRDTPVDNTVRVLPSRVENGIEAAGPSEATKTLVQRLPSKQDNVVNTYHTWKRKSTKHQKGAYATLRLRHGERVDIDQLASDLDATDGPSELQADNIKGLGTTLSIKKAVRDQLQAKKSHLDTHPNAFKRMEYGVAVTNQRFRSSYRELLYRLELWRSHLKTIEGHFGTGVTSYFSFLKRLFLLNIPVFVLTFAFVVIPQILYRYRQQEPSTGYVQNVTFHGWELLTGGEWFLDTELYYGYYFSGIIAAVPGLQYDMRYAYICTCGGYYLLTVIILGVNLSKSYKKNYIQASSNHNFYYVAKVFCGWDYAVTNPKAAELKHKSIFKELQEYLAEFRSDDEKNTCAQFCALVILRIFFNIIILGLIGGTGYMVWYISVTQSLSNDIAVLQEMAVPLCISAVNFILPFAFSIIGSFERYRLPRTELYLTMVRTMLLYAVTLGVLIYFWYNTIECSSAITWSDRDFECKPCWETFMGQQIYQLVIVDFIFILVLTLLSEVLRRLMSQYCCKSLGSPEFNIGRNTLNLIYSQVLVWLGTFYSPLLSVIMILKLFILFHIKRISVLQNCVPSVKPWRAGRTATLIQGLLFLAFLACFVAVGYGVVFLKPAEVCGPYQGYNTSYAVIGQLLDKWQTSESGHVIKSIIEILTSVAFMALLLIALGVGAYYCKVTARGYEDMVRLLRNQIHMEGKDKAFLLRLLQEASSYAAAQGLSDLNRTPWRASAEELHGPISPGGKRFAKTARLARDSDDKNTPRRSGDQPRGQSGPSLSTQLSPPVREAYNRGYLDTSVERDGQIPEDAVSMDPESRRQEISASNPAYRDSSPMRKPDLPYPTQPYAMTP